MEAAATLVIAIAAIILFWSTLREILSGITGNTRRVIRVTDKQTRKWLAEASIEEMQTASSYCNARGWNITESAQYEAFIKAMEVIEAEPSQQKKLADELVAYLRANQAPTPTPTPQPTVAPIVT
jgi:TRAP-type C4-dicarboxylate transport system substrate-binding protein